MLYDTHVYVGPTLDKALAKAYLPEACYHPPIQCGELLRLLRLDPKRVIIIDGFYEHTPSVWHKEILYVMDQGVEVWGAASMGALRAAELEPYGMKGVGVIFEDFLHGRLNDDDEVAVLHSDQQDGYKPINDAMVNIRATLNKAYQQKIISTQIRDLLCGFCKDLFYPYRLLSKAIDKYTPQFPEECKALATWINTHGVIDLKKNDAISVLKLAKSTAFHNVKKESQTPMTGYLKTLLNYTDATPFKYNEDWLPPMEKELQSIAQNNPSRHALLAEMALFMKHTSFHINEKVTAIDNSRVLDYIHKQNLYSPEKDFQFLLQYSSLKDMYALICQRICQAKLTTETIETYMPVAAHYYDIPYDSMSVGDLLLLKRLFILIIVNKTPQFKELDIIPEYEAIILHLNGIAHKRAYTTERAASWMNPTAFSQYQFMSFIVMYIHASTMIQGFNRIPDAKESTFFKWITVGVEVTLENC